MIGRHLISVDFSDSTEDSEYVRHQDFDIMVAPQEHLGECHI